VKPRRAVFSIARQPCAVTSPAQAAGSGNVRLVTRQTVSFAKATSTPCVEQDDVQRGPPVSSAAIGAADVVDKLAIQGLRRSLLAVPIGAPEHTN